MVDLTRVDQFACHIMSNSFIFSLLLHVSQTEICSGKKREIRTTCTLWLDNLNIHESFTITNRLCPAYNAHWDEGQ